MKDLGLDFHFFDTGAPQTPKKIEKCRKLSKKPEKKCFRAPASGGWLARVLTVTGNHLRALQQYLDGLLGSLEPLGPGSLDAG